MILQQTVLGEILILLLILIHPLVHDRDRCSGRLCGKMREGGGGTNPRWPASWSGLSGRWRCSASSQGWYSTWNIWRARDVNAGEEPLNAVLRAESLPSSPKTEAKRHAMVLESVAAGRCNGSHLRWSVRCLGFPLA